MRVLFLTSHPFGKQAWEWLYTNYSEKHTLIGGFAREYGLGISFLYNYRVPREELAKATWINFHPAPLPEYGGRNVAYHAILNGATEFGATVHYMTEDFDAGDIIEVRRFPIQPSDNAGDIAIYARMECLKLFQDYVPRFLAGERPVGVKQRGGTYYKKDPIDEFVPLTPHQEKLIRAITAEPHYPYVYVLGRRYEIRPADE